MRLAPYLAIAMIPAMLAACAPGSRHQTGAVVGAVAGGLIGNSVVKGGGQAGATIVGAVIGGIIGHEIGRGLDERDRQAAMQAEYQALEYGQSGSATPWRNPDSGHRGTVVPGRPYMANNRHCRTYTHTIYIDGRPETMQGRACRQPDGKWQAIS